MGRKGLSREVNKDEQREVLDGSPSPYIHQSNLLTPHHQFSPVTTTTTLPVHSGIMG
jgi:hypothetical protein